MSSFLLHATVALLVAIDPIGLAPIFVALTDGRPSEARKRIALLASIIAACVLIGASIFGSWLLGALGISLPAFRIAGGLLLFVIAFEMLFDLRERRRSATIDPEAAADHDSIAAFPLAIPLIAGPAAISAVILLGSQAPDTLSVVGLDAIIAALVGVCFAVFLLADRIDRLMGRTGRIIVSRLLGLILAALAVQFVADGIQQFTAAS